MERENERLREGRHFSNGTYIYQVKIDNYCIEYKSMNCELLQ